MPVSVVDRACKDRDNGAVIVVEGDSIEEVTSLQAKQAALADARRRGLPRAGISGSTGPYPVDQEGRDMSMAVVPGMRYRNDYQVSGGI